MTEMFNVGVRVSLIDRVSRQLGLLGGRFGAVDARVVSLQRSLNALSMQRDLTWRRAQLARKADQDALRDMRMRYSAMGAAGSGASEDERAALRRRIVAREERAGIARDAERLRLTRLTNRELETRSRVARDLARHQMVRAGVGVAASAVALDLLYRATRAAGELQTVETNLRAIYQWTRPQTQTLRKQAFTMQSQLGNITAAQFEKLALALQGGGLSAKATRAVLPETARVADVMAFRYHMPLKETAVELAQLANLFNLRTAKSFKPMAEAALHASLIAPGSLSELQTQASYVAPLMRKGFSWRDVLALSVAAQREGGRGAISPENLATLLTRVQTAGNPLVTRGLAYAAALNMGLPQFLKSHPHFTLPQLLSRLEQDRKREGSQQYLANSRLLFGVAGSRTAQQLSKPQTVAMLGSVERQMAAMAPARVMVNKYLNTLAGQSRLLGSNFKSLGQVVGGPLVPDLQKFVGALAKGTGDLTKYLEAHKKTTDFLSKGLALGALYTGGRSIIKLASWWQKFRTAKIAKAAGAGGDDAAAGDVAGADVAGGATAASGATAGSWLNPLALLAAEALMTYNAWQHRHMAGVKGTLDRSALIGGLPRLLGDAATHEITALVARAEKLFDGRAPAAPHTNITINVNGAGKPHEVARHVVKALTRGMVEGVRSGAVTGQPMHRPQPPLTPAGRT